MLSFLILINSIWTSASFAQVAGDYKSVMSGNWNSSATWERYDGTTWVPTPIEGWPGENAGTVAVMIRANNNVMISENLTTTQLGTVTIDGTLTYSDDWKFTMETTHLIITADLIPAASIGFTNKSELRLPVNSSISLNTGGLAGAGCSNNTNIFIGLVEFYCSGTPGHCFSDLASSGGNPKIITTTSSYNCGPGTINLSATASPGSKLSWYDLATEGTVVGTGNSFSTSVISAMKTFYVEAQNSTTGLLSYPRTEVTAMVFDNPVTKPLFSQGTNSSRYQSAEMITYMANAVNTSGITYTLDETSITGGNSIEAVTGKVTYVAGWSGTSVITASAAGCDGPQTATHTVSTTWCFAMFTATGAVTNNGASCITGDVGTNDGAYSGFLTATMVGQSHVEDCVSLQAAADVVKAYNDLKTIPCGVTVSGTSLGINPVLGPNVYYLGGALNIGGDVTLDGQNDPESKFIFQVNGALSTLTNSKIILTNGARVENVYWQVYGAIELGAGSVFIGTMVCQGAITLLTGATLMGRALTTVGAIVLNNNVIISTCSPILGVINNVKPTFILPDPFIECVESLSSAIYDPITIDINKRPDYYTFKSGNKLLDLTGMDNNCCSIESMTIKWRLDFSDGTFLEHTGQPSVYGSDILFPGDGITFSTLVHKITYTLVGCTGNESLPQSQTITIKPRPNITKVNL